MISRADIFYDTVVEPTVGKFDVRHSVVLSYRADSVEPEDQQARFDRLASQWESATKNLSSVQAQIAHPDYIKIIAMGPSVVRLILTRMKLKPGFWFAALRALTEADPVPEAHRGDIHAMTDDWLQWGKKNAYIG